MKRRDDQRWCGVVSPSVPVPVPVPVPWSANTATATATATGTSVQETELEGLLLELAIDIVRLRPYCGIEARDLQLEPRTIIILIIIIIVISLMIIHVYWWVERLATINQSIGIGMHSCASIYYRYYYRYCGYPFRKTVDTNTISNF